MKKYIKPEMEFVKLRVEERIAGCSNTNLIWAGDAEPSETCEWNWHAPTEGDGSCYDLLDCAS